MECEDEESLVDVVIEDIAVFDEEIAILDKKSIHKENLESKFEAPRSFPSTGDIYETGGLSLHSESLSEDQDEKHCLLEEHLLMLHLSLEGSPSQEITGNVLKAVTGAQTALRSARNIRQNLIKTLVHNNTTEALFRCFRNLPSSLFSKSDLGLIHGLQVIAKLASKDAKMAVKCRLVGGVKLTHQLIHTHSKNNQLLLPLLIILKFITKNQFYF
ncbi:hypothetical protein Anas_04477 [Armadillidium nasatum]|uniref:Uncharacterized protein n=1 Tax=Armadillidium nasatum TaxID=96803 RepID=A0A5N5TF45_9CRUS|nr:hypothetical protein Anas_04477 [Armadillidium nasatum]